MPRLIHEIDSPAQAGGGARRYVAPIGAPFSSGMRADIMITVGDTEPPEEIIYVEGDARLVVAALRDAILVIESCAKIWVDDGTLDPDWQVEKQ